MNAPADNLVLTPEQAKPALDLNLFPGPDGSMGAFFAALAAAQGLFEPIEKNRAVTIRPREKPAYSFRYADLAEIRSKTVPHTSANGLTLIQLLTNKSSDRGGVHLRTILGHASGARIECTLDVVQGRNDEIKDFGAYTTYLRRYVASGLLGVAADDDLDQDPDDRSDAGSSVGGYTPDPVQSRNPSHSATAEFPPFNDAKSIKDLTAAYNKLTADNKSRFEAHYERRLKELDPPAAAAAPAAAKDEDL